MTRRIGFWTSIGLGTMIGLGIAVVPAAAQSQYGQPAPPRQPAAGPAYPAGQTQHPASQPQRPATPAGYSASPQYPEATPEALVPRDPQLHRRTAEQGPAPASRFVLSPQEQADLDWVLEQWERHGADVKTFECKFTRFDWDPVWQQYQPMHILQGEIRYAAPDKGMFRVDGEIVDYRWEQSQAVGGRFVKGQQAEHWICNGKSVFEYDFQNKQLVEHKLPPDLQGKAISDSPLPFLFGSTAEQLKHRYFLRIVTPAGVDDQIWLEAYPKYQADAANFLTATLILTRDDMQPSALKTVLPNGKSSTVYQFQKPKVNVRNLLDPLNVFENNWLHPRTPAGWTRRVEQSGESQASRVPMTDRLR